jgi:hypothetical protein
VSEVAPWWSRATHHPIARIGRRWHLSISSTLVLARSANDAGASTAAQSGRTKGTSHLPYGSGETKGELPLRGQSEREALRS